jgi:hypothetical protein
MVAPWDFEASKYALLSYTRLMYRKLPAFASYQMLSYNYILRRPFDLFSKVTMFRIHFHSAS